MGMLEGGLLNFLHNCLNAVLGVNGRYILNDKNVDSTTTETVAEEMRSTIDQLKMEAFDTEKGLVDYSSLRGSPTYKQYKRIAAGLRYFDPANLTSREEKLAFWVNLYNSLIIDAVITFGIEKIIWEAGRGFFRKAAYNVGGFRFSADDIVHGILRGNRPHPTIRLQQFRKDDPRLDYSIDPMEPRIHFALVCASSSCPLITVYHAKDLEFELTAAASTFVNGGGVVIDREHAKVNLSRIFKWYQEDFGGNYAMFKLLLHYLPESEDKAYLSENFMSIKIGYQKYNWALNHM